MSRSIAIVEDDISIRKNYTELLEKQGYKVQAYSNRKQAQQALTEKLPDLAIIDIGLEDEIDGGFTLCQALRQLSSSLPIIFLTARDNDFDTVSGLRMGADDYLTKDISLPHMLARIAALFRRIEAIHKPTSNEDNIICGSLTLCLERMLVHWQQQLIELTVTEFWLVHSLIRVPGHVKSRQQLMEDAKVFVDDSTITSHIKRIRKKFILLDNNFDCIDAVYGMGYRWKEDNLSEHQAD
ncbi:proteobacterial dedicated sortase system response regulator [Colwellia psychrerythraea]|uniref:Two component transcriptional regulator, winged helix family n=1 Tax=Colwellia psychrerythraea TaxID=28229 RepID=A0A099KFN4_COLPS|nr:proteobacterial dedicated sortase system response regulator [Colwellia psychrerythraea]KGJ89141.1 two component transcriptional regulator, winged helix family [Colwellia psychrerythraea]